MGYRQNLYLRYWDNSATGDKGFTARPLFFVRGGNLTVNLSYVGILQYTGDFGRYWAGTNKSKTNAFCIELDSADVEFGDVLRNTGRSLRCVAYIPRQRPRTICCSFILQPGGICRLGCFELPRQLRVLLV